ncbi:hypothetical protein BO221_24510 [Archangium sp. Cb G35]|uniref:hypothetical protein n=1 Tax=Archangium sp. Cb G35 TaxID=1920190 RepID=UPI000936B3D2|nr:hypothetical protein [Archangium sp. Cb G35]OJT21919.1 hypothetical protein BO221_24510 [Archangium sp. Cb G35]
MISKMAASALPVTFTRGLLCCAWLGLGVLVGTSCRPPLAACTDDAREDDDTREQALATPPLSHIFGHGPLKLDGQVACPGDTDWLYAYADCCHPAGVSVRWEAARGALEVDLLDAEGVPLSLDAPGDLAQRTPGEVRLMRASHGGPFLVRIRPGSEAAVPYTVELSAPVFVR